MDTYWDGVSVTAIGGGIVFAGCAFLWVMFSSPIENRERMILSRASLTGLVTAALVSWVWFAVIPIVVGCGLGYLVYRLACDAFSKN